MSPADVASLRTPRTVFPRTLAEERHVEEQLARLIEGQGRIEGTLNALVERVDRIEGKADATAAMQAVNVPILQHDSARIDDLEKASRDQAALNAFTEGWRRFWNWMGAAVGVAVVGAIVTAVAGRLHWVRDLFAWGTR